MLSKTKTLVIKLYHILQQKIKLNIKAGYSITEKATQLHSGYLFESKT